MPVRLNVKGPGPFIRDHLLEIPEGRDFVGSMFHAYKAHLRAGGVVKLPCRPTFHSYVWKLKETNAIVFDGAEEISFTEDPPETLPGGYVPACGMPAPRHYYRIVDAGHPAFDRPEAVWRESRGLPAPVARPRVPIRDRPLLVPAPLLTIPEFTLPPRASRAAAQRLISHLELLQELGVDEPEVQQEVDRLASALEDWSDASDIMEALDALDIPAAIDALGDRFPATVRLTPAARLEREGRTFLARIEALRIARPPDLVELASLEADMLDYFDRALDAAARARGDQKTRLVAIADRLGGVDPSGALVGATQGFEQARAALALGDLGAYEAALDVLAACCPPEPGEEPPVARPPEPPERRELPAVPTLSLSTTFSSRSVPRLEAHLVVLKELAEDEDWPEVEFPALEAETAKLLEAANRWKAAAEEATSNEQDRPSPREERLEGLEEREDVLDRYVTALENQELSEALDTIQEVE